MRHSTGSENTRAAIPAIAVITNRGPKDRAWIATAPTTVATRPATATATSTEPVEATDFGCSRLHDEGMQDPYPDVIAADCER